MSHKFMKILMPTPSLLCKSCPFIYFLDQICQPLSAHETDKLNKLPPSPKKYLVEVTQMLRLFRISFHIFKTCPNLTSWDMFVSRFVKTFKCLVIRCSLYCFSACCNGVGHQRTEHGLPRGPKHQRNEHQDRGRLEQGD